MMVRVLYSDNSSGMVKDYLIDDLINEGRIAAFYRSSGWVDISRDPIRGMGGEYHGPERRKGGKKPGENVGFFRLRALFMPERKEANMKVQELKEIAKQKGVKVGKMKKSEIIRAIQEAEGNTPCFNTGKSAECGQLNCLWRDDCE